MKLIFIVACIGLAHATYLSSCEGNGNMLEKCLLKSVEDMRKQFRLGIPEVGISSIEPITIDRLDVDMTIPDLYLKAAIKNIRAHGASHFEVQAVKINDLHAEIKILVPHFVVTFDYNTKGSKYQSYYLDGKGTVTATIQDLVLNLDGDAKRLKATSPPYIAITSLKPNIKYGKADIKVVQERSNLPSRKLREYINSHPNEVMEFLSPVYNHLAAAPLMTFINMLLKAS